MPSSEENYMSLKNNSEHVTSSWYKWSKLLVGHQVNMRPQQFIMSWVLSGPPNLKGTLA